jgi:tRNA threonylcarbamoyladenosine biosynthesis protein TsaB
MLVAIDTATHMAGLALYDPDRARVLAEETWHSARNHTVELMPRLARMLEQHGVAGGDLTGLVVSLGPGSFTGLRTGLGVAKGLALARRVPLVGIPTLDVVAQPHFAQRLPILAVLQAGRGRICVSKYIRRRGRWRQRGNYQLTTWDSLCDQVDKPVLICGEIEVADAELVRQRLGALAVIVSPASSLRRAGYLAELGWDRLSRGDSDDIASLSPIYLQEPQIDA